MGRYAPLGHDPSTVRWRKWIMPRGLVRAVGIEPTLLAERDFESDETMFAYCGIEPFQINRFPGINDNDGFPPDFSPICVGICVSGEHIRAA